MGANDNGAYTVLDLLEEALMKAAEDPRNDDEQVAYLTTRGMIFSALAENIKYHADALVDENNPEAMKIAEIATRTVAYDSIAFGLAFLLYRELPPDRETILKVLRERIDIELGKMSKLMDSVFSIVKAVKTAPNEEIERYMVEASLTRVH